jgi:hypothetical protein
MLFENTERNRIISYLRGFEQGDPDRLSAEEREEIARIYYKSMGRVDPYPAWDPKNKVLSPAAPSRLDPVISDYIEQGGFLTYFDQKIAPSTTEASMRGRKIPEETLEPWLQDLESDDYEPTQKELETLQKQLRHHPRDTTTWQRIRGQGGVINKWLFKDHLEWLQSTDLDALSEGDIELVSKIWHKAKAEATRRHGQDRGEGFEIPEVGAIIEYIDTHAHPELFHRKEFFGDHDRQTHALVPERAFSSPVVPEGWTYAYTDRHGERIFKRPR